MSSANGIMILHVTLWITSSCWPRAVLIWTKALFPICPTGRKKASLSGEHKQQGNQTQHVFITFLHRSVCIRNKLIQNLCDLSFRYLARPSDSLFAWARHYFVQDLIRWGRFLNLTQDCSRYCSQDCSRYCSYNLSSIPRHPSPTSWNASRQTPPDNAICIHIRHGDKFQEMTWEWHVGYSCSLSLVSLYLLREHHDVIYILHE